MRRFALNPEPDVAVYPIIFFQINYMHRMAARVVFVLLLVHSGPRVRLLAATRPIPKYADPFHSSSC